MNKFKKLMQAGCIAIATCLVVTTISVQPAQAVRTVFDPWNYGRNLLTAARNLQQLNNQITQLANEAQMLINQVQNLTNLPTSIAAQLQGSLRRIDGLVQNARGLAYDVGRIDQEFQRLFPEQYSAAVSTSQLIQDAQQTWRLARDGFKHSLEVQAEVIGRIRDDAPILDGLIANSQSAVGNLQALQAGNQLTAFTAKQSMQLQTLLAASARAEALQRADALAARERARARFTRFLGDRNAYTR